MHVQAQPRLVGTAAVGHEHLQEGAILTTPVAKHLVERHQRAFLHHEGLGSLQREGSTLGRHVSGNLVHQYPGLCLQRQQRRAHRHAGHRGQTVDPARCKALHGAAEVHLHPEVVRVLAAGVIGRGSIQAGVVRIAACLGVGQNGLMHTQCLASQGLAGGRLSRPAPGLEGHGGVGFVRVRLAVVQQHIARMQRTRLVDHRGQHVTTDAACRDGWGRTPAADVAGRAGTCVAASGVASPCVPTGLRRSATASAVTLAGIRSPCAAARRTASALAARRAAAAASTGSGVGVARARMARTPASCGATGMCLAARGTATGRTAIQRSAVR